MYPLSFADDSEDLSFPLQRSQGTVSSLVDLSSQAVIKSKEVFAVVAKSLALNTAICSKLTVADANSPCLNATNIGKQSNEQSSDSDNFSSIDAWDLPSPNEACSQVNVPFISEAKQLQSNTDFSDWIVPIELRHALLKAALLLFRDDAVEKILSAWPSERLILSQYVEPMFYNVNPLYSDLDLCMEMRRGVKYTTCLAHSFMVCLKRKDRTKLRYLDLTGFPTGN